LLSRKSTDFTYWLEILDIIINKKGHLTTQGLIKIREIRNLMHDMKTVKFNEDIVHSNIVYNY